jgi:hypothetical protein
LRLSIKTGIFKKIFKAILMLRIHSKNGFVAFYLEGKGALNSLGEISNSIGGRF